MIRTKETARRTRSRKNFYVLKKKLSNLKLVQFRDKPFKKDITVDRNKVIFLRIWLTS